MQEYKLIILSMSANIEIIKINIIELSQIIDNIKKKNNIDYKYDFLGLFRKKTECEKKIDNFLNVIPLSSNYVLRFSYFPWSNHQFYRFCGHHQVSYTRIGEHIRVINLTNECEIGLSKGQYAMLVDLQNDY